MSDDFSSQSGSQGGSSKSWSKAASDTLQDTASYAKEEAGRQGAAAVGMLKDGARTLGDEAMDRASRLADEGKEAVTSHLDVFAQAIKRASDELNQNDQTVASQIVRQAAGGLESLSRSINGTSLHDMVDSVRSFARNNPAAFFGGAVLTGLALGRFMRASSPPSGSGWDDYDWRDEDDWGSSDERRDESGRGGNEGISPRPYAGSSYGTGEGAAFTPSTGGAGDRPSSASGYAGGGMANESGGSAGSYGDTGATGSSTTRRKTVQSRGTSTGGDI